MPKKRLLIIILILLLLALAGGGAYLYFFRPELIGQIRDWITGTTGGPGEEGGEEEGDGTSEEVVCEGQTYTNTRQGYEVCYPAGWYTQAFGYSQLSVGFDAAPIPEASEYGGVFVINVSREASSAIIADFLSSLTDPSTTTVAVDSVSGIRVEGTIPADSFYFANYRQTVVVMEKFGRTYTVTMLSSPDGYADNLTRYNAFVESWKFLEGTAAAPWERHIYLTTPWPGDSVSGSFQIAGSAQGAFENTIVARLKTASGTVLFQGPITYNAPDMGELGYFDIAVTFTTTATSGTLEVYHTSAMDGSIGDLVTVPLTFE